MKDNIKQDIALPICTRRSVLKTIASIFDPLGFFCPWVLEAKMFLQSTVKETKNWDEELIHRTPYWLKIRQNLSLSSKFDIKRSLYHTDVLHYELHIFSDASAESYGACAYLRQVCENENIIDLIFAKQRLKPVNKDRLTIPRLELMGALIGCRILNFLRGCIQKEISTTYLWCDSKCVLGWLRSNKILPAFVERRVTEIKRSKIDFLAYVASESNPANLLTRIQNEDDEEILQINKPGPQATSTPGFRPARDKRRRQSVTFEIPVKPPVMTDRTPPTASETMKDVEKFLDSLAKK